jgi:hypothetical protein
LRRIPSKVKDCADPEALGGRGSGNLPDDSDLFLGWAAEEFVAAGRADGAASREAHRRQAEFFADVFDTLNRYRFRMPTTQAGDGEIGELLSKAFAPVPATRR